MDDPGRQSGSWLDAALALPGTDDSSTVEGKSQALRVQLLLNVTANHLLVGGFGIAATVGLCLVATLVRRLTRVAALVATGALAFLLWQAFPDYANHNYLQLLLIAGCAFFHPGRPAEQVLLLQLGRWLVLLAFLWSGLQKVLYTTYFQGQYLAFKVATDDRFTSTIGRLLPAEEVERLQSYEIVDGAGPYQVDSVPFLVLSNVVYLSELLVAALLLWKPTRRYGWIFGILVVLGIELVAREMMFGLLCVSLFLCFPPGDLNRRWFPLIVVAYALGLLMHYQWLPGWWIN